jgi:hypothetical protein
MVMVVAMGVGRRLAFPVSRISHSFVNIFAIATSTKVDSVRQDRQQSFEIFLCTLWTSRESDYDDTLAGRTCDRSRDSGHRSDRERR